MNTKKNAKRIIQSRHFRSLFRTITVIVSFASIMCFLLTSIKKSDQLIIEIEKDNIAIANTLQGALKNTQGCAAFVGSLPSVSLTLNHNSPNVEQLSGLIDDITSFSSIYDYERITLFFEKSSRIYDSGNGIYSYEDYYDQAFLNKVTESSEYERWISYNGYPNPYSDKKSHCITYIHRLPIYETSTKGYVSFSLPIKYIEKLVEQTRSLPYPLKISLKGISLWDTDSSANSENEASSLYVYNPSYSTDDDIIITRHLTIWPFLNIVFDAFIYSLLIYLVALGMAFIISYYATIIMLRPVERLLQNAGLTSFVENTESDEYDMLNNLIDEMSSQIKNKDTITAENKQLIQEQLLYNLLYGYENPVLLPEKYEQNGIIFPYNYFTLVLIDFMDVQSDAKLPLDCEQIMLFVKKNAEEAFSHIGKCYSMYLGNRYISLILNTDYSDRLRNDIYKICTAISVSTSETLSARPIFGITTCSGKAPNLYHAMLQTQRLFLFAEKDSESPIYFSEQAEYTSSIDSAYLLKLTQGVLNRDNSKIKELRSQFTELYTKATNDLEEMRRYCKITISSVHFHLLQLNIRLPESFLVASISKLDKAQSIPECETILFNCLSYSTNDTDKISEDAALYIQQAIRYLELHYSEPIAIPQIASHVGISSIYLNRLFKATTKKTLSDYLNEYRITQSLELLKNKQNTIAYISEQVGYNDVRSYIRFFKKYHKLTPNEYRLTQADQK